MAEIQSLSDTASVVAVETLLCHAPRVYRSTVQHLLGLLQADHYTAVSELVLRRMLSYYPQKITDELLHALAPVHLRKLDLRKATMLTASGIRKILRKCPHLNSLDLSEGPSVDYADIFSHQKHAKESVSHKNNGLCMGMSYDTLVKSTPISTSNGFGGRCLTTLVLSRCQSVDDHTVHKALRFLPNLQCLHLAGCNNITDDVFLLDDDQRHYGLDQGKPETYQCHLNNVDVSTCSSLTSTAIRYLVSLCGPTLKVLDISATSISGLVLLFLCGYSLRTVVELTDQLTGTLPEALQSDLPSSPKDDIISEVMQTDIEELRQDVPTKNCNSSLFSADGACISCSNNLFSNDVRVYVDDYSCGNSVSSSQSSGVTETDFITGTSKSCLHSPTIFTAELIQCFTTTFSIWPENSDVLSKLRTQPNKSCAFGRDGPYPSESDTHVCLANNEEHELDEHISGTKHSGTCGLQNAAEASSGAEYPVHSIAESCSIQNTTQCMNLTQVCTLETSDIPDSGGLQFPQVYTPCLESLNICYIELHTKEYAKVCLQQLLTNNPKLRNLNVSWKDTDDDLLENAIAKHGSQLTSLSLVDCPNLTTSGVAAMCSKCTNLTSLDIQGVGFIEDAGVQSLINKGQATRLGLSETMITDASLNIIASNGADELKFLDLSWCEELGEAGINRVIEECHNLRCLLLRQCPITELSLCLLADNCVNISQLLLPGVNCVDDRTLVTISLRLKHLEKLDISWNLGVTDTGMVALLSYSNKLLELETTGVKLITIKSFWPLVSDLRALMRCTMALKLEKLKNQCGNQKSQVFSSDDDEEGEELILPTRSTVYAPSMKVLRLEWCDLVNDDQLAEITSVCRGSLTIIDYYGSVVEPSLNLVRL